jgi:AcrR family transcriptional regulator
VNDPKQVLARRQEMERQERRERILNAARNVFFKKGYFGATVRDIALEAELSPGLIYHYYDNKDAVYGAICEEAFLLLLRHLQDAAKAEGTVIERLNAVGRAYVDFYIEKPEYFEIISFKELGFKKVGLPDDIRQRLEILSEQTLSVGRDLVIQGMDDGSIVPTGDPWEMTLAVWAGIEGVIFIHKRGYLESLGLDLDHLVERELSIIGFGIRPR